MDKDFLFLRNFYKIQINKQAYLSALNDRFQALAKTLGICICSYTEWGVGVIFCLYYKGLWAMRYRHGFLVSTLRHQEEPFSQSVIYICEHSAQGSLGFVINKPLNLTVKDLLKSSSGIGSHIPIFLGGPMKMHDRGFVLHRNLGQYWQGTSQLASDLYLTTTDDLLQDISQYPEDLYKVCVGYTGWQEGQLEYEISQDYWVWMPFDALALFYTAPQDTWRHCYTLLGFSPDQIGCVDPGVVFKH